MTGFTGTQICRLLVCVGEGCESLMDETMRDLACKGIQVDEIWSFVGTKQRRPTAHDNATKSGDMWTFANAGKRGAVHKYRTLSLPEICAFDVFGIAAPNWLLALWWVLPMPAEALEVVSAWGFTAHGRRAPARDVCPRGEPGRDVWGNEVESTVAVLKNKRVVRQEEFIGRHEVKA
jgi:hypothetical protein